MSIDWKLKWTPSTQRTPKQKIRGSGQLDQQTRLRKKIFKKSYIKRDTKKLFGTVKKSMIELIVATRICDDDNSRKLIHFMDTTMLRAILNKSWKQHPTKQLLYGHLPPITKSIKIWRTRHAGHPGRDHKWCTLVDPFTWTTKCRATSSNLRTAALCRYGV